MTPEALWAYIEAHRRVTGKLPKLRECVEHFGDKRLNVLMALGDLEPGQKDEIRQAGREEHAKQAAKNKAGPQPAREMTA